MSDNDLANGHGVASAGILFRVALRSDLNGIVRMLAEDPLGATRERYCIPLLAGYEEAFSSIDSDPNNEIVVAEDAAVGLLGFLQITYIPNLTYQGRWRAQIEGVRVRPESRSTGIGRALVKQAIFRARQRGCHLVQLTSDKSRGDALRFYESLGFLASHEGLKLAL